MLLALGGLFVYPVKSARGVALDAAEVEARGLALDRRWMVVDADGRFVTQRERPELARVEVALARDHLGLRADGVGTARVALARTGAARPVTVWDDTVAAVHAGDDAARFFSQLLGAPHALVAMPESTRRAVDPAYAAPDDVVSFADGFPLLVTSTASLEALNRAAREAVPMDRFRPNLVVTGAEAWAEDGWKTLRVGAVSFRVAKPCARCVITTTDQRTGARGAEPLVALAALRRVGKGVLFGQNLIPDLAAGGASRIAVGDAVIPSF